MQNLPSHLKGALNFPLVEALFGRRSRRFSLGASIPDGVFSYTSQRDPVPLTELERTLVLSAVAGVSGWNYLIMRNARYAPHLPNYSGSAVGRPFPSPAGFETCDFFFTDDTGVYFLSTRDAPSPSGIPAPGGVFDIETFLAAVRPRIRKLADGRLKIPAAEPHMEGHNTWCVNRPGSLLVIPVANLAQELIATLCYYVQNGYCIYDDIHRESIPGIERFSRLVDTDNPLPLSFIEMFAVAEATAELSTSCYAGALMLQAMGLGGWMFDGMNPFSVLGASGDPEVPGLGFRYDTDERWPLPNPTGLAGVFEGFCPPHYPDMHGAVTAFSRRKFGEGGPFHPGTPGPWKESGRVRGSAEVHGEEFIECVSTMAQYVYDRFGKFPGTVPSIFLLTYLQAHHLDLEFYDRFFKEGAYLRTHAEHMAHWHGENAKAGT